ncbi:MAG TPA: hypothetical protein VJN18_03520 [Polyangiaceae bacterium]|nr:hypothetical protein [Polyangiaceae bacterium]
MWSWYLEWSQIARVAIKQRALRAVQGLAKDYLAVSQTSRPNHKAGLIKKAIGRARNEYEALRGAKEAEQTGRVDVKAQAL